MTDKTIKDFENELYRQIQALKEALERYENIYQSKSHSKDPYTNLFSYMISLENYLNVIKTAIHYISLDLEREEWKKMGKKIEEK